MTQHKIGTVTWALALWILTAPAWAQAPAFIPVQGVLTDETGAALDGEVDVTFSLYESAEGGMPFFTEVITVVADDGLFTAYLGNGPTMLSLTAFERAEVYLGLTVRDDDEMTPRLQIGSAPYAAIAQQCSSALSLQGLESSAFARSQHTHTFSDIVSPPAGLADGDDDTLYSAGDGIALNGTSFSIDPAYAQRRLVGSCSPGSSIRAVEEDGTLVCEVDGGNFTAGVGLSFDTGTLSVDSYANLARKDAAAGNQVFGGSTLVLDFANNRVGVGTQAPAHSLDVGGDVEVDGEYRYAQARTFSRVVASAEFRPVSGTWVETGVYGYATNANAVTLYARPDLPQGAVVTALRCYYYDAAAGDIDDFDSFFVRRPLDSVTTTDTLTSIHNPVDTADAQIRSIEATGSETIDNSANDYFVRITYDLLDGSPGGPSQRFYGCRIAFSMAQASAH